MALGGGTRLLNMALLRSVRGLPSHEAEQVCRTALLGQLHTVRTTCDRGMVMPERVLQGMDTLTTLVTQGDWTAARQTAQEQCDALLSTADGFTGALQAKLNLVLSGLFFCQAGMDATLAVSQGQDPVEEECSLQPLLLHCVEDIRAFSIEKYGVAPEFEVLPVNSKSSPTTDGGGDSVRTPRATARCVAGHVSFIVHELLKNATVSMVNCYSTLDVEDAPPVTIELECSSPGNMKQWTNKGVTITVTDRGEGVPAGDTWKRMWDFGYSSTRSVKDDSWRYSREFGAAITGKGVGLPRSRVLASFGLGTVAWVGDACDGVPGNAEKRGAAFVLSLPYS